MTIIDTDYLIVGAGAAGMAFADALIAECDVVIVDRRHRPGGHWNDAYPFVRIHQASANYGVNSRVLGTDSIDTTGPNAGFYELADEGGLAFLGGGFQYAQTCVRKVRQLMDAFEHGGGVAC